MIIIAITFKADHDHRSNLIASSYDRLDHHTMVTIAIIKV